MLLMEEQVHKKSVISKGQYLFNLRKKKKISREEKVSGLEDNIGYIQCTEHIEAIPSRTEVNYRMLPMSYLSFESRTYKIIQFANQRVISEESVWLHAFDVEH